MNRSLLNKLRDPYQERLCGLTIPQWLAAVAVAAPLIAVTRQSDISRGVLILRSAWILLLVVLAVWLMKPLPVLFVEDVYTHTERLKCLGKEVRFVEVYLARWVLKQKAWYRTQRTPAELLHWFNVELWYELQKYKTRAWGCSGYLWHEHEGDRLLELVASARSPQIIQLAAMSVEELCAWLDVKEIEGRFHLCTAMNSMSDYFNHLVKSAAEKRKADSPNQ